MLTRPFTIAESLRLVYLAAEIGREDAALGDLVARLAGGDDTVIAQIHDRLNVLGRFDNADRIRQLIGAK